MFKIIQKKIAASLTIIFFVLPTLASAVTIDYKYDAFGNRVSETDNETYITYYISPYFQKTCDLVDGDQVNCRNKKFVIVNDDKIATVDGTGTSTQVYYHHNDYLGGTSVTTDASGTVVSTKDYFPFGGKRIDESTTFQPSFGFAGYREDNTGLNYLGARYYNPNTGQFLSQDPLFQDMGGDLSKYNKSLFEILSNPQSLNSYSYALNNPIINRDPTGEATKSAWYNPAGFIPTAIQTGFWWLTSKGLNKAEKPITSELMRRSITINPTNLTAQEGSSDYGYMATAVKQSDEFNKYITGWISDLDKNNQTTVSDTRYDDNSVKFDSGDLGLAIHGTKSTHIEGEKKNGQWNLTVQVHDIYDYDLQGKKNYNGDLVKTTANNTAWFSQSQDVMSNYGIDIKFNYTK